MQSYSKILAIAKAIPVLTGEQFADYGGSYFNDELGLWIGQDADGGGIIPFGFQMANLSEAGDEDLIRKIFRDLGRSADVEQYDREVIEAEESRQSEGYKE